MTAVACATERESIEAPAVSFASSTGARRRARTPEQRRHALLDAAESLFLSKGVTNTSIDDIVAVAQIAKGTFYLYFASRDALLSALQQRFIQGFCERMEVELKQQRGHSARAWEARLRLWFAGTLDGLLDQVALHDMLFHDVRPGDRELMKDNPVILQLAALLHQGAAAGVWQVADARAMALMMFYAMHGLADDAVMQGRAKDRVRIVQMLMDTFGIALWLHE